LPATETRHTENLAQEGNSVSLHLCGLSLDAFVVSKGA
jgi:hypothetical protein